MATVSLRAVKCHVTRLKKIENRDFFILPCIPHPRIGYRYSCQNITTTFGVGKSRMAWITDGEKFDDRPSIIAYVNV